MIHILQTGIIAIIAGGAGITLSGYLCDLAKRKHPFGRLYFVCFTASFFTAASVVQYLTHSATVFYCAYAVATFFVPMWFGPLQATTQDLVIPRLRGTAFAAFSLGPNIFGLGLGPYCVGLLSDASGDLRFAILCALGVLPISIMSLLVASRLPARRRGRRARRTRRRRRDPRGRRSGSRRRAPTDSLSAFGASRLQHRARWDQNNVQP